MDERQLGSQGLRAATVGYGSMGIAVGYGPTDDRQSVAAIRRAYELGTTLFDTAEMYGWGQGEKVLGRAVAPFRDEIVIATKFGLKQDFTPDSQPSRIRKVVDASLTNLGCDTIDLLYQHRLDPTVPIEDVVGTMSDLVAEGKVTYLGLCEATPEAIRRAHAVHPISVLQTEFSLFAQDAAALFPLLDELAIGFVAYSPLARGFLGGVARPAADYGPADFRAYMDWWKPENFRANTRIVDRLAEIAGAKDASVAQIALAWVLAQREFIVPIPGSRNTDRVLENVMAADMSLTTDELSAISATAPTGAHGDRGTPSPWLQDRT